MMRRNPAHNRARSNLALAISAVLALGLLSGISTEGANAAGAAPGLANSKPVIGIAAKPLSRRAAPASSQSVKPESLTATTTGTYSGILPSDPTVTGPTTVAGSGTASKVTGSWRQVGASGIDLAAASPATGHTARRGGPTSVSKLTASVLSAKQAQAYGLKGLVIKLRRTDGIDTQGSIAVRIPNSVLGASYGGDYASRLRWVEVTPAGTPIAGPLATPEQVGVTDHPTSAGVASVQDAATKSTVLSPQVGSSSVFLTASGTPTAADGSGNFAATPLTPASSWQVSAQTGDFSWSYPMRTPPAAAGPSPDLAFNYDSQAVDGETGSSNNQPSAVGEGWTQAGGGYIERSYVSCSQDDGASGAVTTSGDLCWKTDNATISLGGHSGTLVKDSTSGAWKLQSDDGSRIEHLVGTAAGCSANGTYDTDCWRVTTTDGTQYYFGLNQLPGWSSGKPATHSAWTVPVYGNDPGEPCHAGTFAASSCLQAWRWNLDYVVDVHGNAESLYYDAESNSYAQDGGTVVSYLRGGQIDHIDYGFTDGNAYATNAASDQVTFGYAADGRCSDATLANCSSESITAAATAPATASYYPDVPFDQLCSSSCPTSLSPTFWTDGMLNSVTTWVLKSGVYSKVDSWALSHSFPDPGDGTAAALWLTQIVHTGYEGAASLAEPATVFTGLTMQNRVWAIDGLAPLDKYRISSIAESSGSVTSINYSAQECTPSMAPTIEASPQTNTYRCFPQWWTPDVVPPQAPQEDLFHKYVVTSVVANPETGGGTDQSQETDYVYTGTPAWRYDTSPLVPNANRTWNVFAGYNTVEIRTGDHTQPALQGTTDYTFYQGMDGDRASTSGGTKSVNVTGTTVPDSLWFAGQVREQKTLMGVGGATQTDTINVPWTSTVTSNDGTNTARHTGTADSTQTSPLSTSGTRTVDTATTFNNATGLPLTVDATASDVAPTCATYSYAPTNTTAWLVGLPSEVAIVRAVCASLSSAVYPGAAVSDTRTYYDTLAWNATPTKGDSTKLQKVDSYTGTTAATAHWITSTQQQYDALGRPTQTTDALGHTTSTAFTPSATAAAGSGPLTSQTTTNTAPFNWTSTTAVDPAWGVETSATDVNGESTTATYDALGRRTAVWYPDNPQATAPTQPSVGYSYTLSTTSPNAIATKTLTPNVIVTGYDLYDGLGRNIQSQSPAFGGGSVVTDNWYDSQGRVATQNGAYWAPAITPSATLFVPTSESQVSSETTRDFDAIGRTTRTTLYSLGTERHHTDNTYYGVDRVDATPPAGGTPSTSFTNSAGQQTALTQYLAATPGGDTAETTSYTYDSAGHMATMTDPAGSHWAWTYNVLGNQIEADDPDSGTATSTYDAAGNKLTSTDARGVVLAYKYDELNRLTATYKDSTGSSGSLLDSWTFDTLKKAQLTSSSSYTGSTPGTPGLAYTTSVSAYDAAYHPTSSTVSIPTGAPAFGGTSYTTTSAYYAGGDLASVTYPAEGGLASERVRTTYNGLGTVAGLVGTNNYDTASYTAIGQLSENQRIGTTTLYSDYGYDVATGQVTEIKQTTKTGSVFAQPADAVYTNDEAGNVTEITTTSDTVATDTQCFSYDHLAELTSAWTPSSNSCSGAPTASTLGGPAPYWTDYGLNPANGNRTSTTSTTATSVVSAAYSYPAATAAHPHAVQSVATTTTSGTATGSYGYDADGATTTRPSQTITYDPQDRLSSVTAGSNSQSNVYDATGDLLLATDSGNYTLYLGVTELHKDGGSSTASAVRTYAVGGSPIAERTTAVGASGSILRWIATDNHNTGVLEVVATSGVLTSRYEDPFGNARGTAAPWSSGHQFLNADLSDTSNTLQLGARAYDPTLGRFLSVDPVLAPMNPLQNNGYSYAGNSPVTASDPSGDCMLSSDGEACIIGKGGSGTNSSGTSGSSAPSAAGNGAPVQVSPHVYDSANDPKLKLLKAQFHNMVGNSKVNETVEMNLWYLICQNGGSCSKAFLSYLRSQQVATFDGGIIFGGPSARFIFMTYPDKSAGGSESVAVRQLDNPESMAGVSREDLRIMAQRSGWVRAADNKFGNEQWTHPEGSSRGVLTMKPGSPNVPDPSGTHLGENFDMRAGGLDYHASMEGSPGAPSAGMKGYFVENGGASGDPNLARPFPDVVEGGGFGEPVAP